MKELSIEQKAKAYDEALERMKSWAKGEHPECFTEAQKAAEFIFPELKESEDDRTRKDIIRVLKGEISFTSEKENKKYITWLEKQGTSNPKSALEAWKAMRFEVYQQASGNRHGPNCSDDTTKMFSINDIDEIFEKICEQNPTDKIETKFHEGDSIVHTYCRGKIIALTPDAYLLDTGQGIPFSCEDNMRLWTIQDAKVGDVLASKDGVDIVIFRNLDSNTSFSSYYNIKRKGELGWSNNRFIPATKEQRDALFTKIKEAGYEWDAEKKELKKIKMTDLLEDYIEQKPVKWTEEDEKRLNSCLIILQPKTLVGNTETMNTKWLKSLKERIGG